MFNISSIYPKQEGAWFDFEYYLNTHMPRSIELLSEAKGFVKVYVEKGVDVEAFNITSQYEVVCNYYFESVEDFTNAFMPHAHELQGDIANYTNIEPIIQITEIKIEK